MAKQSPSATASPCRVLVVDDRDISRRGVCSLLGSSRSLEVVGAVRSTDQVAEIVRTKEPTLVVMKLGSPAVRYFQMVRWIKQHSRRPRR
jgi:DNA-binding NarL/FixJ family response regulator